MSTIADLKMIRIEEIVVSNTNPRKTFDEKAMSELTESIKSHGILQPILVRPVPSLHPNKKAKYELVCGERRFRASMSAGIETIPCNVRELTHDEAFELQIIENLERKDVHPLDEADAFKKMLDSGKYTIADIAAKMAKTETFVVQRLKLVDLIEEIRKDFLAGHLGIGHAILIARCDAHKQNDFYEEAKPWKEGDNPDYGTVAELREKIKDDTKELSKATFDINDENLVSGCGACTACPKRSASNPVLFDDFKEDVCFDDECFDKKTEAAFHKDVARIVNDAEPVILIAGFCKPDDFVINLCKQFDVKIYKQYDEWNIPPRVGEKVMKAFGVSGVQEGKYLEVSIKESAEVKATETKSNGNKNPMSEEEIQIKSEINGIKERQQRALELDGEKVWQKIRELSTADVKSNKGELSQNEINALCYAMISKLGYYGNSEINKNVIEVTKQMAHTFDFTQEQYNQIARIFFVNTLPIAVGSHTNTVSNIFYTRMLKQYAERDINNFEAEQIEVAKKRIARAEERIKELEAKLQKRKSTPESQEKKAADKKSKKS